MQAGGRGSVTSPMPSRITGVAGFAAVKAPTRLAMSANRYEALSFV